VGSVVWARYQRWADTQFGERRRWHGWPIRASRCSNRDGPRNERRADAQSAAGEFAGYGGPCRRLQAGDIVIDATASERSPAAHAHGWRAASTWSPPTSWGRAPRCRAGMQSQAIAQVAGRHAVRRQRHGRRGLPLLRSLRALVAGGDRIHAIAGVLSGSLAWLCNEYDGAAAVLRLRAPGRRGRLHRARSAHRPVRRRRAPQAADPGPCRGYPLEADAVQVESLVPAALAPFAARCRRRWTAVARCTAARALRGGVPQWREAALRRPPAGRRPGHGRAGVAARRASAGGWGGTDNRVAIWSDRYRERRW
jgi:homoserine dehydrogenase